MLAVVYGTLKKGYSNNGFLRNATFVQGGIVRGHKLYYAGFPVAAPSEGDCIKVEVWDIGDPSTDTTAAATLKGMDRLEGYHEDSERGSMYLRRGVTIFADDGTRLEGQMYVGNARTWRDFKGMREMGKDETGIYQWP